MTMGTAQGVFKATSTWSAFSQALVKNKASQTKNWYPDDWSSEKVSKDLEKIKICRKNQLKDTKRISKRQDKIS